MNNYNRICGVGEMELNIKNQNSDFKNKKEMVKRKSKSAFEFQNVFENEINRLKKEGKTR